MGNASDGFLAFPPALTSEEIRAFVSKSRTRKIQEEEARRKEAASLWEKNRLWVHYKLRSALQAGQTACSVSCEELTEDEDLFRHVVRLARDELASIGASVSQTGEFEIEIDCSSA